MGQCTSDPKSTSSTHNDYHCVSGSKNSLNRRCSSSSGGALVTATSLKRNSKGSVHEKRNSNGSVHEGQKKPSYIEPMVKIDISDESIYQSDFESDNDYNIGDCDEYVEEMPENNQHNSKSRRKSYANPLPFPVAQASEKNSSNRHAVQTTPASNSIFLVEDVVKKSGCETFVINFNDGSDNKPKPVPHMIKKLPRPKTTAACSSSSNRLKVKPSNSVSKDIDFKPSSSAISVSDKPTRLHSSRQKKGPYEQSQEVNTSKVLDKRRRGLRSAFAGKGRPKKTSLAESATAVSTISTGTTRGRDRTFSCPSEY